jgi:hypothetical protein
VKVFLSWSGERSRQVAEALRIWLPCVIQAVEPWMSSSDIDKGTRWGVDLATQLSDTKFGVICLTPENLTAPWILFEAGALSKTLVETFVCPYLYELQPSDVAGPLAQFQATKAQREDTWGLVQTLNSALGDQALSTDMLSRSFQVWWLILEENLAGIPMPERPTSPQRSERDVLDEVLTLVRHVARHQASAPSDVEVSRRIDQFTNFDLEILKHWSQYGVRDWTDMAMKLSVNEGFLRSRVRTIMTALNADSPVDAVQHARAIGLLDEPAAGDPKG